MGSIHTRSVITSTQLIIVVMKVLLPFRYRDAVGRLAGSLGGGEDIVVI